MEIPIPLMAGNSTTEEWAAAAKVVFDLRMQYPPDSLSAIYRDIAIKLQERIAKAEQQLQAQQKEIERLSARPSTWKCGKCGYGSTEHGMEGHPAYKCFYDPVLIYHDEQITTLEAQVKLLSAPVSQREWLIAQHMGDHMSTNPSRCARIATAILASRAALSKPTEGS